MLELELVSMEKVPVQPGDGRAQVLVFQAAAAIPSVKGISHHWMADVCQMDPDLMRAAGFYPHLEEGQPSVVPFDTVVSDRPAMMPGPR